MNDYTCQYCEGEGFRTAKTLAMHEKECRHWTDELRAKKTKAREMSRAKRHPVAKRNGVIKRGSTENRDTSAVKRVRITLSLDWNTVRALLVQLGPEIEVDRVELA